MTRPELLDRPPRRVRGRDERGSGVLQLVVVFPVVLLLIFGVVQGALYYHARDVALAAAQQGLAAARVEDGSAAAGGARARAFLARAGDGLLVEVSVSPARTAVAASVTVRGRSLSLAPGLPGMSVSQTAAGTVERLTAPGQP